MVLTVRWPNTVSGSRKNKQEKDRPGTAKAHTSLEDRYTPGFRTTTNHKNRQQETTWLHFKNFDKNSTGQWSYLRIWAPHHLQDIYNGLGYGDGYGWSGAAIGHLSSSCSRLEVSKGKLSWEKLPYAEGVAKDVCLDAVLCVLGEDFRCHPAKILKYKT